MVDSLHVSYTPIDYLFQYTFTIYRFLRGEISIDNQYTHKFRDMWSYHHGDTEIGQTYNALEDTLKKRVSFITECGTLLNNLSGLK